MTRPRQFPRHAGAGTALRRDVSATAAEGLSECCRAIPTSVLTRELIETACGRGVAEEELTELVENGVLARDFFEPARFRITPAPPDTTVVPGVGARWVVLQRLVDHYAAAVQSVRRIAAAGSRLSGRAEATFGAAGPGFRDVREAIVWSRQHQQCLSEVVAGCVRAVETAELARDGGGVPTVVREQLMLSTAWLLVLAGTAVHDQVQECLVRVADRIVDADLAVELWLAAAEAAMRHGALGWAEWLLGQACWLQARVEIDPEAVQERMRAGLAALRNA